MPPKSNISKLRPGDRVSTQCTSSALERIRKSTRSRIRFLSQVLVAKKSYRPENNAVDYTLADRPRPAGSSDWTEGFKLGEILKQNVPVFEENAVNKDLLNEGRRNLLNYLQSRGYFEAKVICKKL